MFDAFLDRKQICLYKYNKYKLFQKLWKADREKDFLTSNRFVTEGKSIPSELSLQYQYCFQKVAQ